jgi:hypothetical protein
MPASSASARGNDVGRVEIDADDPPGRVAGGQRERAETMAAAELQIRKRTARADIEADDAADQAG